MKKVWGLVFLFMMSLCGAVLVPNEANAYYKDNCYAIQYSQAWTNGKGDRSESRVYSSKTLCYKDKKISQGSRPSGTNALGRPTFKNVTNDSVTVNYCSNGKTQFCPFVKKEKTYKLSDYGSFEKMVRQIDADITALGNWSDYKKIAMDKNDAKTNSGTGTTGSDDDGGSDGGSVGEVTKNCANQGGAQSLGWIICPILTWAGEAAEGVYNGAVEPALNVEPKLFSDSDSSVQSAWEAFRDIANVIFAIITMLVILSQLTGVGIDNYGIKKILPKLVVTAVLVNFSYILCLLAVDISNILGNGLQGLFEGLKESLTVEMDIEGVDVSSGEVLTTAGSMIGLAVLGYFVKATGAIWEAPQVALMLFIAAIGVVVSIFFLFILLSAREAAIVVLIVLAPVAMVLYVLPNTKSYFDKWMKMLGGLLAVYPIAGLLVGGGNYVAALLLHTGMSKNFFGALTAMIAGVLPIFFIPSVLRQSINAIGNLGGKITSFGSRAGAGLQNRAENSRTYQSLQDRASTFANKNRYENAKRYMNGTGFRARFGRMVNGGRRGFAGMAQQVINDMEQDAKVSGLNNMARVDAAATAITKGVEAQEVADYMTLINDRTRNGEDEAALFKEFDNYMSSGNKAGAVAAARIAGRRKDTASNFMGSKLTGPGVDAGNAYDAGMLQSVAKEIATGDNSGNYRAAAPLGFEFASQINKSGVDESGSLTADSNYAHWAGQSDNVKDALEHHVTNSSELVGMKNSALDEIATMMESGQVDSATMQRLGTLATSTIANKGMGPWDSTKEANLNRIARFAGGAASSTVAPSNVANSANGSSMTIPHDHRNNISQNLGGGGGADSVSE